MAPLKFSEPVPGLLQVTYEQSEDLGVAHQAPLLARLEAQRGAVVILFDVAAAVNAVPIDVPTFWLGVTARPELAIAGMGIITVSVAVRVAARGFGLANAARRVATEVQTFKNPDEALRWARALLAR